MQLTCWDPTLIAARLPSLARSQLHTTSAPLRQSTASRSSFTLITARSKPKMRDISTSR